MLKLIKKIFGDKSEKDIKELWPVILEINKEYEKLKSLSDDELKAKTAEFKEKIKEFYMSYQNQNHSGKDVLQ